MCLSYKNNTVLRHADNKEDGVLQKMVTLVWLVHSIMMGDGAGKNIWKRTVYYVKFLSLNFLICYKSGCFFFFEILLNIFQTIMKIIS